MFYKNTKTKRGGGTIIVKTTDWETAILTAGVTFLGSIALHKMKRIWIKWKGVKVGMDDGERKEKDGKHVDKRRCLPRSKAA